MAIQKKNAKARLDKYYYLAKEKGYRARAAFKLIQLNKKYSFLQSSKCLLDLCAAPGSWLQVAAETMPMKSLIVGVDLAPIKPIPRTITFQDDITSDRCRSTIRGHLKTWKADTVVHDGAPNVGTAWVQDAFSQNDLVLASLKLATEFLAPNGTFVTKVFRSKDSAKLEWIFKQLFGRVEQTKPPSSRNVSAETFYVCRGFKAPKHLDPRFLDSRYAFAEVEAAAVNNEAKVFNPEKKKRKREGYEEGDYTQFHEVAASDFIQTQDPIQMLGNLNRLHFRQEANGDIAQAALDKLPETTQEIRDCCADLRVLGRKEFKLLLRWRLKARERFGFRQKKEDHISTESKTNAGEEAGEGAVGEEVAVVESMDDEMRLQEEIKRMNEMQSKTKRKERRRENEKKQKEIVRLQMHMTTPADIGIEAGGPDGGDATFRLKDVDKDGGVRRQITRGRMVAGPASDEKKAGEEDEEGSADEDEDGDELERQLDGLYDSFQERREDRDTKLRAKRTRLQARGENEEEFEGFDNEKDGAETDASSNADLVEDDEESLGSEEEDGDQIMTKLQPKETKQGGLSGRAASFFQQDIFKDIGGLGDDGAESEVERERDSGIDVDSESLSPELKADASAVSMDESDSEDEMVAEPDGEGEESEVEETTAVDNDAEDEDWEEEDRSARPEREGRPNIDIITAEAMTLAHALATGKTSKAQLTDDNFNKYSHRDTDGLPEWFLDDENKHSRPQRPVISEAAKAIKEKQRALNARPIKKVREAKARKTLRTARRLEKLKKKSEGLAEGGDMSEKDKANNIASLMAKAKKGAGQKKNKKAVKVVRAGGVNKGAGRPRGVKGKYKMVDPRLKKDVRGEKRAAKKMKGKK
ncbi:AdoMet-dependent rRNA methyltransferase spb1 [Vermiconidia calcicola]|uniref:AdoMet-dependent rRNA methyltransferase spb1 n=1 Tax=Vermiconidia calcicola TaxID=1690605 RepID=A0ACC3N889_9PEZI|nr:AdoMet-dependent rRNA methyltransferase spb1 [Vermiconidia calcicola]